MARDFESTNEDHIEIGDVPALNIIGDEVSLSAWIRAESFTSEMKILAKWSDSPAKFSYLLSADGAGNNKVLFAVNTSSTTSIIGTTSMSTGQWFHLAGTYDGATIRAYLNGIEENSTSKTGNISSNTAPVRIGVGSGATDEQPFDGDIGHCAIWDVGLSASEIKSLASGINPLKIHRENLLSYSPLNGQDPEYDVVGGLDLTVNGPIKAEEPPIPNSIVAP